MVNPIRKHTSTTMSKETQVPIIILDDDDDDLEIDKEYKMFEHLRDDKPIKNRVSQQRKKKTIARLVKTSRESIQRDNRLAQRRKRKIDELVTNQENIQQDNKAMKKSESKAVPLVRAQERVQRDNKGRKIADSEAETLRKEAIQRDNRIDERRKKKILDETKAAETSSDVPVERVDRFKELKAEDETPKFVPVTKGKKVVYVESRKKNEEERVVVVDKDYLSYLTWLVDSLKDSTMAQNDRPDIDPPIPDIRQESTLVPEKELLVKVKDEPDLELLSDDDDDDIIAVSDSPFTDGVGTPFVPSKPKNVIDADKETTEDEDSSSWFKKELMDVLGKPYDEEELSMLSGRISMKKPLIRCRELRHGRESSYKSDKLGKSYLEKFSDGDDAFNKEYERVDGDDKARLALLRGFFFYLENISKEGAFRPWKKSLQP